MDADLWGGSRLQQKGMTGSLLTLWHRKLALCQGTRTGETLLEHVTSFFHSSAMSWCLLFLIVPHIVNLSTTDQATDEVGLLSQSLPRVYQL